jgi:kynurenine 3-monooxygenase
LLTERVDALDYGYKELTVPPTAAGDFALSPEALHIWPRGSSMMIALPNPDRSFTCTLFWPTEGPDSLAALDTPVAIGTYFAACYPDFPPLAPDLIEDYTRNPVGRLGTVRCSPWQTHGRVVLIGDAAHAIVPFFGQGANCAFEDVVELDRCVAECGSWAAALPEFERRRLVNAEAIAEMALNNFVEMRDKVASPWFRAWRGIEHTLQRLLPGIYLSRYEQVSFSTTPYELVRRRAVAQHWVLGGVLALLSVGAVAAVRRRR